MQDLTFEHIEPSESTPELPSAMDSENPAHHDEAKSQHDTPSLKAGPRTTSSSSTSTPVSQNTKSTSKKLPANTGSKRTRVESLASSMADTDNRMLELAAGRQDYKTQSLSVKRQKYLAEADKARYEAEERTMASRERMMKEEHVRQREKEEHQVQMMRLQIELVRAQNPGSGSQHNGGNQAFGLGIQQPMGSLGDNFGMGSGSATFSHLNNTNFDSNNNFDISGKKQLSFGFQNLSYFIRFFDYNQLLMIFTDTTNYIDLSHINKLIVIGVELHLMNYQINVSSLACENAVQESQFAVEQHEVLHQTNQLLRQNLGSNLPNQFDITPLGTKTRSGPPRAG